MIGSLRGVVIERPDSARVLLEVGGVGYLVSVTPETLAELEPGTSAYLHVHHHIREDNQQLFGFLRRDERIVFQTLIAAHGIGPSLALAILGTHTAGALVEIVATNDVAALTLVPGVGRKTAERIVVELRGRLSLPGDPSTVGPRADGTTDTVREALSGLGYTDAEIREALRSLPADVRSGSDSATLLRSALGVLGADRA
jgi:Holliday junction DNA helicase RuvA